MSAAGELCGLRVLVTRAAHQSSEFAARLIKAGADVLELPLLRIVPPADWTPIDNAIEQLHQYQWIIFASGNAVDIFLTRAQELGVAGLPDTLSIGAIGPATADSLRARGHQVRYQPRKYVAESFVKEFPGMPDLSGQKILWLKADIGRDMIGTILKGAGAEVVAIDCYHSALPENAQQAGEALAIRLADRKLDVITLASGQTARNLLVLLQLHVPDGLARQLLAPTIAVTIGPETTKAAQSLGFARIEQADEFTTDGMFAALKRVAAGRAPENH